MSLHEEIKNNIKEALKAGDKVKLEVMRGILTAFINELVVKRKTPQEMLDDTEALAVITRLSKQRKDSIEQFKKGDRLDLVKEESEQLEILEKYLPKLMELSEIEDIVKIKISELDTVNPSKKGILMSIVMKDLKGKADGSLVKKVVDKLFV